MGLAQAAVLAIAVAALAWRAGALDRSGAVAAAAVGCATLSAGGWLGGVVLIAFFLPSSAISRLWAAPAPLVDTKGDRRDAWQVLANGGPPALAFVLGGPAAALAFSAGLAAAAADTWATTVGAHSPTSPRHILTGRSVPAGTSGGVTVLGAAGSAAGAALVAGAAVPLVGWRGAGATLAIGVAGMLLDSILGAGLQGRFHCDQCGSPSEQRVHRCGNRTRRLGGWTLVSNDGVNALTTTAATLAGWAAASWPGMTP